MGRFRFCRDCRRRRGRTRGGGGSLPNTHRDLSSLPSRPPHPQEAGCLLGQFSSAFVVPGRGGVSRRDLLGTTPPDSPTPPRPRRVPKLLGELDYPGLSWGKSQRGDLPGAPPPSARLVAICPLRPVPFLGGSMGWDSGSGRGRVLALSPPASWFSPRHGSSASAVSPLGQLSDRRKLSFCSDRRREFEIRE